jgi:serine/threonine protein kinase/formylglycine-generating enzyme required for sulfatase activity
MNLNPQRPPDAQDLAPTLPTRKWDDAATIPVVRSDADAPTLATVPVAASSSSAATLPATLPTQGGAPDATQSGTHSGTAVTLVAVPSHAADTLPTQHGDAATRVTSLGDAATLPVGTALPDGSFGATQSRGALTGEHSRTGTVSRTIRTRINLNLPADAQQLDRKLQTSRTSVLADMATARQTRGTGAIPKGLQKLIEQQGTEGRYAIDRPLAAGGMGAVLKIEDHDFRRGAAMKVIHARFADQPEALERFLAEAQITAQLEHPNIVPIHDLGTMEDGTLYYTMKLIEGRSLNAVVKQLMQGHGLLKDKGVLIPPDAESLAAVKKWTVNELILLFLKVLDGVGYANSHGVVHRDLKPDNIMLGPYGEVLVVDWGIAKVLPGAVATAIDAGEGKIGRQVVSLREGDVLSATLEGQAMGTIFYMPPEQAKGELSAIDARSDIYALGATLYEVFALRRCMNNASLPDMVMQVASGNWIAFDKAWEQTHPGSKADPDLTAIIHKAMAYEPAKRYASCAEFAADLRRFIAGQGALARKRNIIERIGLWYAAHRRQVQVGVGVVIIATAAVMVGSWYGSRQQRELALATAADAKKAVAAAVNDDVRLLQDAAAKLQAAITLNSSDAELRAQQEQLLTRLGKAEQRADAEKLAEGQRIAIAAKIIELRQAAEQLQKAAANEKQPQKIRQALEDAERVLTSAIELDPKDSKLDEQREKVRTLLRDDRRRAELQAKQTARSSGQAALERAEQQLAQVAVLPADITALNVIEEPLKIAEAEFQKADGLDGMQELIKRSDRVRSEIATRLKKINNRDQARRLLGEARAQHDAKDFSRAVVLVDQANELAPSEDQQLNTDIRSLRAAVLTQQALAQEQQRRDARQKEAAAKLATARELMQALDQANQRAATAQNLTNKLDRELAAEPVARKEPLFIARRNAQTAQQEAAQRWAESEVAAQNALALVADQMETPNAAAAQQLLADLYVQRLRTARAKNDRAELLASRSQLQRYDVAGRYRAEIAGQGTFTLDAAQPITAQLTALRDSGDGRLVASGNSQSISSGQPLTLDAGSYRVVVDKNEFAVAIGVNEKVIRTLPAKVPEIPGHVLRLVHVPKNLGASFLLGQDEITVEQYQAFLNDPAILAQVKASWAYLATKGEEANENNREPLLYIPRLVSSAYEPLSLTWKLIPDAKNIQAIEPFPAEAGMPVTGISRADAEAFCAWLSQKTKLRVRLPSAAERTFAATGGDPARVYPWGSGFDRAFAINAFSGTNRPTFPGSNNTDTGPFGHRDLAGNVREWLADRPTQKGDLFTAGTKGALVAGGSWADEAEFLFRSSARESIDDIFVSPVFGFRILVELP